MVLRVVLNIGVLFLLSGCEATIPPETIPPELHLPKPEDGERWLCKDGFDAIYGLGPEYDPSIILTRETPSHEPYGYGRVSVAGVVHDALFSVSGVNRRWDWNDYIDAIVIEPGGDGGYYDFRLMEDGEDTVKVRQTLECVQG